MTVVLLAMAAGASLGFASVAEAQDDGAVATGEPTPAEQPASETVPLPAPSAGLDEAGDYLIGAPDLLRILVWRSPELSTEVPVRPDGRISVPLLGDIQAAGMTTHELRDRIATGLSEFISAPDVTVIVLEVNSKVVYLVGAVSHPTAVPLNREMRVLDAISVAGGFSPFADRDDVRILRPLADGSIEQHEFNYKRFVKGKDPDANLLLRAGDTIVVPD